MINVSIIGGGNVAYHLIKHLLRIKDVRLVQLYNRSLESIHQFKEVVQITSDISTLKKADVFIISVTDNAIMSVSEAIPHSNCLVVHTSGSIDMNSLNSKNRKGVFYPLQTFSKQKEINFSNVPICIEAANENDYLLLQNLAEKVSKKVYRISSQQRQYLHVSAVFVCNFVNHMYTIGHSICKEHNIPFEILHPLILETAEKIKLLDPTAAQTGPAKRKDTVTIQHHLNLISTQYQKLYKQLTESIIRHNEKTL